MMIKDLIKKNRSVRGYDISREVADEELREMVDCARLSASSVNMQPLKYVTINTPEGRDKIIGRGLLQRLSATAILCQWASAYSKR